MSKLLYSVTMSLDGFIAGPGGDMSWLTELIGPNPEVDALIDDIGALLVGRRTYGGDDPYKGVEDREGKAFGGGWEGPQFVLTHRPPRPGRGHLLRRRPRQRRRRREGRGGRKYVNVRASVAKQCLEAGCSTRSSRSSRRCCSATASASSTIRAGRTSSSSGSA